MDKKNVLDFLSKFISIQSVSTDPDRSNYMLEAADFLQTKLVSLGFKVKRIQEGAAPPVIIASRIQSAQAKTLGIYGHYDVQPEDPVAEWNSEPFTLAIRDGKLFGRGVADNKGHIVQNIFAIEELIKADKLHKNIVFIIEGEEETGSVHFESLITSGHASKLHAVDVFYVTDTGMRAKNKPQIFYALRGLVYFELSVRVGQRDLHSGIYGNRVLNPIQAITDLFANIKNIETNRVLIPDFYTPVRKIPVDEMKSLGNLVRPEEEEKKEAGTFSLVSIDSIHPSLVTKIMPSFDIHGIWSGYMGKGSKTIIPKEAHAKFSFRLVEHQDPDKIEKQVQEFIKHTISRHVEYTLTTHSKSAPFYTQIHNKQVEQTTAILKDTFNNEVVFNRSGGSIPAAEVFQRLFKKPVILTGFTLPGDKIHSPNENFDEEMFWKGIQALEKIYSTELV